MSNGENCIAKCNICLSALQDFFDFLVENQCPDFKITSRVSGSLEAINALSAYLGRVRVLEFIKKK